MPGAENRVSIVITADGRGAETTVKGLRQALLDLAAPVDMTAKNLASADANVAKLQKSLGDTNARLKQAEEAARAQSKALREMAESASAAATAQKRQEASLVSAISAAKNLAGAYGAFKAMEYAKEAGLAVFEAGSAAERLGMSFKGIEGSGDKAADTLVWIRGEADRLGISFREVSASYRSFLAAAKTSRMSESDIRAIFTAVTEAGTVLGMDSQQQSRSLVALQQMLSKGTVSAEELRQQLGENLPGAFALAAQAMGVSEAQLAKMMERGEVAAKDLLPRLAKEIKATYGDSVEESTQIGEAGAGRFRTAWDALKASFYDSGVVTSTLNGIAASMNAISGGPDAMVDTTEKMTRRIAELRKKQANALYSDEKASFGRQAAELEAKRARELERGYIAAGKALPPDSWLLFDRDKIEADVRGLKMLEEQAKKTLEARAQVVAAQGALTQLKAEIGGDPLLIELTKLQEGYKKFQADTAAKLADQSLSPDARSALSATLVIEGKRVALQEDFVRKSIALERARFEAEQSVQLASLEGLDAYYADMEAIRAKHAYARLKPGSQDAQWADLMESAELAKRMREQRQANQERNLGLEADLSKAMGELYGTRTNWSPRGALDEQVQAVEIERQQRLLALAEKQRQAEEAIWNVRRATGDNLGARDQEEIAARQQELELVGALVDVTNALANAKQAEISTSREWTSGARKAFQDYSDAASNYASQAENAIKNAFGGMEDALASFMVTNKANWGSMIDAMLMDLVKIQLRMSITKPMSDFFGGLLGSAHGNVLSGPGISALSGGVYDKPTFFGFDRHVTAFARGGVLGEAGVEAVMPLIRDGSGNLGVRAQGGGTIVLAPTFNLTLPQSSGNHAQDQRFADQVAETMEGGLNAWWDERYRQSHRPGGMANGGMRL